MSETKPALTPDQWAQSDADNLDGHIDLDIGIVDVRLGLHSGRSTAEDRHILAALALRDQPFGFSWDDVDRLNDAAKTFGYDEAIFCRDLAERIAALLPPRERTKD